ncbi:hypothetical protein BC831DRAFT_481342 [Entophlyctis helioformis]|nr:hypothetical protein BC831DRAFT_481342 [Entophlyctis helioformis]
MDNYSNALAMTATVLCPLIIALSSRHFYSKRIIGKLPFIAGVIWCSASIIDAAYIRYEDQVSVGGSYFFVIVPWVLDIVARSVIIYFTYMRLTAVWPSFTALPYIAGVIEIAQIAALGVVLYADLPNSPLVEASPEYDSLMSIYFAIDIVASAMDVLVLYRLFALKRAAMAAKAAGSSANLIGDRLRVIFFYKATICLMALCAMPIVMTALFATGNDRYFGFNTVLFSFRILLTDVFSNAMRDSLIEDRSTLSTDSHHHHKSVASSNSLAFSPGTSGGNLLATNSSQTQIAMNAVSPIARKTTVSHST